MNAIIVKSRQRHQCMHCSNPPMPCHKIVGIVTMLLGHFLILKRLVCGYIDQCTIFGRGSDATALRVTTCCPASPGSLTLSDTEHRRLERDCA